MPHADSRGVLVDGIWVRGLLIDMDGTILDTVGPDSSASAWLAAASRLQDRWGPQMALTPEDLARHLGDTAREFWSDEERHRWGRLNPGPQRARVVRDTLQALDIDDPELVDALSEAYAAEKYQRFQLFAGVEAALAQLAAWGLRMVLVTNGEGVSQREKVVRFHLGRWFEAVVIEGEEGVGKPHPEVYRRALEAGGLEPEAALMIGDNFEWEVLVPTRLGIRCIWVNPVGLAPPVREERAPWRTVARFAEVPALIARHPARAAAP